MSLSRQVTQPPFRERKVTATSAFVGPSTLLVFEAAAGSSAGLATDSIFYGLDSYKVQKQQLGGQVNVRHLFRGLLPLTMMGTVPSFGMFFFFYEPCKRVLADVYGLSDSASVALASFAAGVPASLIYVPADTVKKRIVLGLADSPMAAIKQVRAAHGGSLRGLMLGWQANLARDVPFAVFKLSLYEACVCSYATVQGMLTGRQPDRHEPLSPHASTACGVASGALTAVLTNPLDVLNTRIKSGMTHVEPPKLASGSVAATDISMSAVARRVLATEGASTLFLSGLAPRMVTLGMGSGIFWGVYAHTRSALGLDAVAR